MFFFSSRRRHTRSLCDWSSDVCSSDLAIDPAKIKLLTEPERVIAHVVALKVEEEKPAEAVAAEGAAPAEPEVIKKGKKEEIGRASCRERVEISVEDGALEKKGGVVVNG